MANTEFIAVPGRQDVFVTRMIDMPAIKKTIEIIVKGRMLYLSPRKPIPNLPTMLMPANMPMAVAATLEDTPISMRKAT